MAQNDYVVRFTGKDDLTKIIKQIKEELNGLGGDKFGMKFERIVSSSANLNNKIKQLKNYLGELSFSGLTDTKAFQVAMQYMKSLEAAVNNVKTASNNFKINVDTRGIEAARQRLQDLKQQLNTNPTGKLVQEVRQLQNALNGVQLPKTDLQIAQEQYQSLINQIKQLRVSGTNNSNISGLVSQAKDLRDQILLAEAAQTQMTQGTQQQSTYLDQLQNKYSNLVSQIQQVQESGGNAIELINEANNIKRQMQPIDLGEQKFNYAAKNVVTMAKALATLQVVQEKMKTAGSDELAQLKAIEQQYKSQLRDLRNKNDLQAKSYQELQSIVGAGDSALRKNIFNGNKEEIYAATVALDGYKEQLKQVNDIFRYLSSSPGLERATAKLQLMEQQIKESQFSVNQGGHISVQEGIFETELKGSPAEQIKQMEEEYFNLKNQVDAANASLEGTSQETIKLRTQMRQLKNSIAEAFIKSGGNMTHEIQSQYAELSKLEKAWKKMNIWAEAYANVRPKLAAFNATINITTSALQTIQGTMSYLGVESESAMNTLNKLYGLNTAVMGISQLIPTIAKLPRILQVAAAACNDFSIAQKALNFAAKQNPWLLVASIASTAVTVIWAFNKAVSNGTKASIEDIQAKKQQASWYKILGNAANTYNSTMNKTYADQLSSYNRLKALWNSTDDKSKFLEEYKNQIGQLTSKVNDAATAEKFFNGNTDQVKKAFMERAKAAAAAAASVDILKDAMESIQKNQKTETVKYKPYRKGHAVKIVGNQFAAMTDEEVDRENEKIRKRAIEKAKRENAAKDRANKKTWNDALKKSENLAKQAAQYETRANGFLGSQTASPKPEKTTPVKNTETAKYNPNANTLQGMRDNVDILTKKLNNTNVDSTTFKEISEEIDKWNKRIDEITKNEKELQLIANAVTPQDINNNISYYNKQLEKTIIGSKEWLDINRKLNNEQKKLNPVEKGSIADLENKLQDLNDKYRNTSDAGLRVQIKAQANDLQEQLDRLTDYNKYTIKAEIEPINIKNGDIWDQRGSRRNYENNINQLRNDYNYGIIDRKTYRKKRDELNKQLKDLGQHLDYTSLMDDMDLFSQDWNGIDNAVSSVDSLISSFNQLESASTVWEKISAGVHLFTSALQTVTTVMTVVNALTKANEMATISASAATTAGATAKSASTSEVIASSAANTIALKTERAAFLEAAAAAIFAAHAYIPFAGVGIATGYITTMLSEYAGFIGTIQGMAAFSQGGTVTGANNHGDQVLARVNAGEMILNPRQQSNLFDILNSGVSEDSPSSVEFKIRGDVLYGVLHNFNKIHNKIR